MSKLLNILLIHLNFHCSLVKGLYELFQFMFRMVFYIPYRIPRQIFAPINIIDPS